MIAGRVLRPMGISVKDYGVVGDGIANDTVALQTAFDSGKAVYIPDDTICRVTVGLTVPPGANICGAGYDSIIQADNFAGAVVKFDHTPGTGGKGSLCSLRISGIATIGLHVAVAEEGVVIDSIWLAGGTFTDGFKFEQTFGNSFSNLTSGGATISGKCFAITSGFSANFVSNWYTTNLGADYNFHFDSSAGINSVGNTFANLTAQGGDVGLYIGKLGSATFTGFYTENVARPLVMGSAYDKLPTGLEFITPIFGGPLTDHPAYSTRVAAIDINWADGVRFEAPEFGSCFDAAQAALLTFSGGGGSGAVAIARVTPGGVVSSAEVIFGGTGYTSDPTVTVSGAGSSATATASRTGTVVTGVTITAGGTGYATSAMPALRYYGARRVSISSPFINTKAGAAEGFCFYPWIVRATGGSSTSGITVNDDVIADADGWATLNMHRAQGYGYQHYLTWFTNAGVQTVRSYVPPVYP